MDTEKTPSEADSYELAHEPQPASTEDSSPTDAGPAGNGATGESSSGRQKPQQRPGADDLQLAWKHHTGWLMTLKRAAEAGFHYFFVGCVTILGLAIVLLIPMAIVASLTGLLVLPAYILGAIIEWMFGSTWKQILPLSIVVTILWTGYFFTHGYPRLKVRLQSAYVALRPTIDWCKSALSRVSESSDRDDSGDTEN